MPRVPVLTASFAAPLATLALSLPLAAQGANDCVNAQPISGLGTFAFDNNGANTDGAADCNGLPVRRDVWFDWTAPTTGFHQATLCGGTGLQTRIAAYDGNACPATALLDCDSITCTFQTAVNFSTVAGQHYLIRVGSRQVGVSGSGTFTLQPDPCPPILDDVLEDNDDCASATPVINGLITDLFVSKADADYYVADVAEGATITFDVLFTHSTGDIDIFLTRGDCATVLDTSGSASDDEQVTYTNSSACSETVVLRVEHYAADGIADCNNYDLMVSGAGPGTICDIGTNFCSSTPNSTGAAAVMSASGSNSVAANDLVLEAMPVPVQPGIFFYSAAQASGGSGVPFGNGLRCVGGSGAPVFRLPITVTVGSLMSWAVDYNSLPPGGQVVAGTTFHFQCWFRDPAGGGAGFDLSDGYTITFAP